MPAYYYLPYALYRVTVQIALMRLKAIQQKWIKWIQQQTTCRLIQQLFAEQGSDGMTIDNLGNIYLTGNGVTVYSPEGKKIEHITIPEDWTANICFGGKDRNILFITASKSVYTLPMKVKGVW